MKATITSLSWLKREIEIALENRTVKVQYSGRSLDLGCVHVDGKRVPAKRSKFWYTPKFDFQIDSDPYFLEIRIWPWLAVHSLSLKDTNSQIFLEGTDHYETSKFSEIVQFTGFVYFYVGLPALLVWIYTLYVLSP